MKTNTKAGRSQRRCVNCKSLFALRRGESYKYHTCELCRGDDGEVTIDVFEYFSSSMLHQRLIAGFYEE